MRHSDTQARVFKSAVVCVLGCAAWMLSGCALTPTATPNSDISTQSVTINGLAHGGEGGIAGAAVNLWAVGTTGYGTGATNLTAGHTIATDAFGNFTITGDFSCTGATETYLTVAGGSPNGGFSTATNSNIMLVAALGPCSTLNSGTFIVASELSTAAAALALGQFTNPLTDMIGAPSTTQATTGITNAFSTVNNLYSFGSGAAITSQTLTNNGFSVTATPEATKLQTIADVLADCVNNYAGACTTLLGSVAPSGATAPADTWGAAVYMSTNPTSNTGGASNNSTANLTALFALVTGSAPWPAVATQPTDWTVGILYTGSGNQTVNPVYDPQNVAIDGGGNVFIINANSKTNDNVSEISPVGVPLQVTNSGLATQQFRNLAIDTNGNAFFSTASASPYAYELKVGGTTVSSTTPSSAYALTINGSNDVFFGRTSSSACSASTAAIADYTAGTLVATTNEVEFACPSLAANSFAYAAVDAANDVWFTNASAGTGTGGTTGITEAVAIPNDASLATHCTGATYPCSPSSTPTAPTLTYNSITGGTGSVPTLATPFGIAVGQGGVNLWLANQTGNTLTEMTSATAGTNFGSAASLNKPTFLAVDGAGNIWVSNNGTMSVSEFSSTGAILSPTTATSTVIGYQHAGLTSNFGIATDPSGNVWVAADVAAAAAGAGVFELVGAAAPTVTPIAQALAGTVNTTGHGIGQLP